ncbi:MAG: hypothetical protein H0V66_08245 [Bdellovibrionales bacterium]|nr:hypothetical protein [Bdellovibrionales bacterium]
MKNLSLASFALFIAVGAQAAEILCVDRTIQLPFLKPRVQKLPFGKCTNWRNLNID